ncbi:MAG: nucleoside triphosphate pyrophosphohydrolase [Deltaproteobacteria bacterium]|nr:nucleoside triphosphate pyrophosphohydrolase [Deltaproteobacteria bacterium]
MEDPEIKKDKSTIYDLIELIESLRGPDGCPWDKKQTPQSMVIYLIEEIYELADAVRSENPDEISEELGDVLFHIFFLARMFQERGDFSIQDVAGLITKKMIRRHPHVFGTQKIDNSDDVVQNWHKIKQSEQNNAGKDSILDSVPAQLPALMRAYMIADRTSKAGIEQHSTLQWIEDLEAKLDNLKSSLSAPDKKGIERQCGDFLFTFVNFVRSVGVHPETALAGNVSEFEGRFRQVEKQISDSGRKLEDLSPTDKDQIWKKSKI